MNDLDFDGLLETLHELITCIVVMLAAVLIGLIQLL